VTVDLSVAGPRTRVVTEPVAIDIGTVGARDHLGAGWYYDERRRDDGTTFVWSRGAASQLRFHLGWRRDLGLELTGRPFHYAGAAPQEVTVELNGTRVGEPLVLDGPAERPVRVRLPARLQEVGENRLVLRYSRVDAPAEVVPSADDRRELGVAWSGAVFDRTDATMPELGGGAMVLPAGGRVDTFVELLGRSVFTAETCRTPHGAPLVVELEALGDGADAPETVEWPCDGRELAAGLGELDGLARIRLSVRPEDPSAEPAAIELVSPRVLTGAGPPATEINVEVRAAPVDPRPNVVIYLVDALRADRLGAYGCDRPLSPRLDIMAEDGIVFTDMIAQSSWTKAAVASIFTGLWPRAHGVNGPDDRLPDDLQTLPERLQAAGYDTGAVVANAYVGRPFGFARGFDHFEFIEHVRGRSEVLHEHLADWLSRRRGSTAPFFLYVHTIDPHAPYAPPPDLRHQLAPEVDDPSVGQVKTVRGLVLGTVEPTPELGQDLRALYDAEVAANDRSFGLLLDELERHGELDDTVVIFTSDHGEAFGEHGTWTHGLDLYNEVLAVPLVIRLPGAVGAGRRVDKTVQHLDLLPTVLGLTGVPAGTALPGRALLDASGRPLPTGDRPVLSYLEYWGRDGASVVQQGWKLIRPLSAEFGVGPELYHHDADRAEHTDRYSARPVRAGWLGASLADALTVQAAGEAIDVDDDTRRQLEALGYMR
jgi:arylsulfatase A-like enzyme